MRHSGKLWKKNQRLILPPAFAEGKRESLCGEAERAPAGEFRKANHLSGARGDSFSEFPENLLREIGGDGHAETFVLVSLDHQHDPQHERRQVDQPDDSVTG